jgi:hypothetical protein
MNRYVIGGLAIIGLGILLLVLITGNSGHKLTSPPKTSSLPTYANTDASVSMVVSGPIVAPQNHNTVQIIINNTSSTLNIYQGYNGHVINSKVFNNTVNSYSNFLYALYYAGYESAIKTSYTSNSGLCPTANRYDFYLTQSGNDISHLWATNCNGVPKSFGGNLALTLTLFEGQIPDFNTIVGDINI